MRENGARPGLRDLYLLEGLNALGTTVFFLGIFFHARESHRFTDTGNLLLAAVQGAAYVAATRAGGRLADRTGAGRAIAWGLSGMCASLVAGWLLRGGRALYGAIGLYSAATALTWPALEAAIARAPGPVPLARRAGLYNVIWSFVGAAGFFLSGPLFALDPDAVFLMPLGAHALQLAGLAFTVGRPRRGPPEGAGSLPEPHREQHPKAAPHSLRPGPEAQARFLRAAWVANGLGYFLFGAFSALAPTIGLRLGLAPALAIWLVSTYLFARAGAFVLFWLWDGWEYRRGWLAAALVLPPPAFAVLFATASAGVAIGALALLGALSGLAYSASLHASLDRSGGEGEGGGLHEQVIGLGILLGPLAGAAGTRAIGGLAGAGDLVAALGFAAALGGLIPLAQPRKAPPRGR